MSADLMKVLVVSSTVDVVVASAVEEVPFTVVLASGVKVVPSSDVMVASAVEVVPS